MAMTVPLIGPGQIMAVRAGVVALVSGPGSGDISFAPTITLAVSASAFVGDVIVLTGQWTGSSPSALDYSADGEATWLPVTNYGIGDGTWSGLGPTAATAGALTISVRDHNNTSVKASASLTVTAQSGVGAASVGIVNLPDLGILQREPDGLQSNMPVRFTYSGTPSRMQGRVTKGAVTVVDWLDLSGVQTASGSGFGVLVGVPPGDGYTVSVRDQASGASAVGSVNTWGAGGVRVLFAGADNQQGVLTHSAISAGSDPNALAAYNASAKTARIYDGAGWHILKNGLTYPSGAGQGYTETGIAGTLHVSRLIQNTLSAGTPSSLTPFVHSGTRIEDWLLDGASKSAIYDASGDGVSTAAGFQSTIWTSMNDVPNVGYGDLEAVFCWLGAANASDATDTSYGLSLEALYQQFLGWVGPQRRNGSSFIFVPVILQGITASPANAERIRKSIMDFVATHQAAGDKVSFVSALDIPPLSDGVLVGADGQVTLGCRQVQALYYHIGQSPVSGMGPYISGAVRSGNQIDVSVVHDAGTNLVTANSGPPTGFYLSTDSFSTGVGPGTGAYVTPSSVAITSPTNIRITLPLPATSDTVYLKYQGGTPGTTAFYNGTNNASANPDVTGAVRDNTPLPSDTLLNNWHAPIPGFPLRPLLNAIPVVNPQAPSLAGYKLTFDEEFNTLSAGVTGTAGVKWETGPSNNDLTNNGQGTINTTPLGGSGSLYTITGSVLHMHMTPDAVPYLDTSPNGLPSGGFDQRYGYFEMRAKLPAVSGYGSAFWLLTTAEQWPPEIDIMESRGNDPHFLSFTNHGTGPAEHLDMFDAPDVTANFHKYGLMWTPTSLTWYLDGLPVFACQSATTENQPFYIILSAYANQGLGYIPDAQPGTSDDMYVDWVRVWSNDPAATEVTPQSGYTNDYGSSTAAP